MNASMKKYLVPLLGAAAFVIGGIIARDKAMDTIEHLDNKFSHKPTPPSIEQ